MKNLCIYDILNGYTTERKKLFVMDIKKLIKKALTASCVYFTVITAVYMLILQFINVSEDSAAVEAYRVLLFFIFSLLFATANAIRSIKQINASFRWVCHYLICAFAFYACFMLPVKMRPSSILTGLAIFTAVYLAVVGIRALFNSRFKSKNEQVEAYQSQFKKQK